MGTAFSNVEDAIQKATGKSLDDWNGEDIPGHGATGILPNVALSTNGAAVRQALESFLNDYVYGKSGKQINEQEMRRLKAALGSGKFSDDRALINGLRRFKSEYKKVLGEREAVFSKTTPQVLQNWKAGGGMTSDQVQAPEYPKPAERSGKKAPSVARPEALSKDPASWTPEDQKAVDAYEKALQGGR